MNIFMDADRIDYTMPTRWTILEYLNKCFALFLEEDQLVDDMRLQQTIRPNTWKADDYDWYIVHLFRILML